MCCTLFNVPFVESTIYELKFERKIKEIKGRLGKKSEGLPKSSKNLITKELLQRK